MKLKIVLVLVVCWQSCLTYAEIDQSTLEDLIERVQHIQNILMRRVYPAVRRLDELDREVATIQRTMPDTSDIMRQIQRKIETGIWKYSSETAARHKDSSTSGKDFQVSTTASKPINLITPQEKELVAIIQSEDYQERRSMFFQAANQGNTSVLNALIATGFNVLEIDPDDLNQSAMHKAARMGHKNFVQLLLASGVPANMIDTQQATPLHEAALWGYPEVAQVLIEAEADVNAKDVKGSTPLHDAAYHGGSEVAKVLIEAEADVHAENKAGETPLHRAARWGHKDVVQLLLNAKANVNARDDEGATPLHKVAEGSVDLEPIASMLINAGARKHAKNFYNKSPKDVAEANKRTSLAKIL